MLMEMEFGVRDATCRNGRIAKAGWGTSETSPSSKGPTDLPGSKGRGVHFFCIASPCCLIVGMGEDDDIDRKSVVDHEAAGNDQCHELRTQGTVTLRS